MSASSGVNALTGEGLAGAMAGANAVVDVTNSPSFADVAVREFFETPTRNLRAEEAAGCGNTVRLLAPPMQPLAADVLAEIADGAPVNGAVELAGPESRPVAEFVEQFLAATCDTGTGVADPQARYSGTALDERGLNPGANPRLGTSRFEARLSQNR